MSQRKFGVEIEHISEIDHHEMVKLLQRAGLAVDSYATGHTRCPNGCYSGWQVKTDGSITTQGDYGHAIELVSPPLSLANLGELKTALGIANKYGAVNSSCGLHVHVASAELYSATNEQRRQLVRKLTAEWGKIEQTIFTYMPLSRRGNANCKSGLNPDDRYQALNVDPLFGSPRHTIEFRAHSATLNFNKLSAWIIFCIRFIDQFVQGKSFKVIDPKVILEVKPKLIVPKSGHEFYLHRPQPGWVIETKKLNREYLDIKHAWEQLKNPLKLPGIGYLPDFQFPIFGNAMTELCAMLNINGIYRSFMEDRYDRQVRKFGHYTNENNITTLFVDDEEDFYNEPLLREGT